MLERTTHGWVRKELDDGIWGKESGVLPPPVLAQTSIGGDGTMCSKIRQLAFLESL